LVTFPARVKFNNFSFSVWFQNRRAKFRKQEKLSKSKAPSEKTAGGADSLISEGSAAGEQGSATAGALAGSGASSASIDAQVKLRSARTN